ncbi:hypothetical protein NDU88_003419 [Pleurodeles waltl]|uniref:Uncharacterized protein n=1 Tax=Pleurodeles waltl TaxID=8319 RepID=A0AAV7V1P3_PLEWA|nr:hypothetical protein NDU88_003419 [Pleurodeles waltl]
MEGGTATGSGPAEAEDKDVGALGQRVDTLEQMKDGREEEMDSQRRNLELKYRLEDLESRSRRSNIRIKGVPLQAVSGSRDDFVTRLFHHVAPTLKHQDIVLDRTHLAGRSAHSPGLAQDI